MEPIFDDDFLYEDVADEVDYISDRQYNEPVDVIKEWSNDRLIDHFRFDAESIQTITELVRDRLETSNSGYTLFSLHASLRKRQSMHSRDSGLCRAAISRDE